MSTASAMIEAGKEREVPAHRLQRLQRAGHLVISAHLLWIQRRRVHAEFGTDTDKPPGLRRGARRRCNGS